MHSTPKYHLVTAEDDILIETRIYSHHASNVPCKNLAFIAHPLGKLGGSFDDHVVQYVTKLLLEHENGGPEQRAVGQQLEHKRRRYLQHAALSESKS